MHRLRGAALHTVFTAHISHLLPQYPDLPTQIPQLIL